MAATYCTDLAQSLSEAPQLPTLGAATKPTATQGEATRSAVYDAIRARLAMKGIDPALTASSIASGWARNVEILWCSGRMLQSKGSLGRTAKGAVSQGSSTAARLIKQAMDELKKLEDHQFVQMLLGNGATASTGAASTFARSFWTQDRDTSIGQVAGTDREYAQLPVMEDGDAL